MIGNNITSYLNSGFSGLFDGNIFLKLGIVVGVFLIQLFFPKGTRTVSRRIFLDNFPSLFNGLIFIPGFAGGIDNKYLREYRCPGCNKLLAKGQLNHRSDILEVKCRGCSTICLFSGEDAEIIEKRSIFLKQGLISDPDKSNT